MLDSADGTTQALMSSGGPGSAKNANNPYGQGQGSKKKPYRLNSQQNKRSDASSKGNMAAL